MKVSHQTGSFSGTDGLKLFFQNWQPVVNGSGGSLQPAVLIFIHGMAEHSGRYQFPVEYFSKKGFSLYAMDLRGHGESDGTRSYAESMDHLLGDIHRFVALVKKKEDGKKIFLIGHSFGGQLVLNYGLRHPDDVDGILVSSPNIRLKLRVPILKRLATPILSRIFPKLSLSNQLDPSLVSQNPEVVEAYAKDLKVLRNITPRLGDIVLENHLTLEDSAARFCVPSFLMHAGDDKICAPEGTRSFFEKIPVRDKTLKIYEGFYHELFNEVGREKVFRDMEAWIEKRI